VPNPPPLSFFVVMSAAEEHRVLRAMTDRPLQRQLAETFRSQAQDLLDPAVEVVPLTGDWAAEEGEVLLIQPYTLPEPLLDAIRSPETADTLDPKHADLGSARALAAGFVGADVRRLEVYFQALDRSRVVRPGSSIVFRGDQFTTLDEPALRLGDHLAAAVVGDRLLFRSLRAASVFLDLTAYYREATNPEILAILGHPRLAVDDPQVVVDLSDTWVRKRFSLLRHSGVLDEYEPARISQVAKSLDLELEFRQVNAGQRILVPTTKPKLKQLLRVLNEEYFRGPLSNAVFITNSKRRVE